LVAGCTFVVDGVTPGGGSTGDDGGAYDGGPDDGAIIDALMNDADDAMVVLARRKSITIDNTKVKEKETDFPVWIDVTDSDLAAHALPDGRDIYFTAGDGTTPLDYQLQGWDPAGHHLAAWVRVPMLVTNVPTVIYVRYGVDVGTPAPNPPGVFKSSFAAVWHLDDAIPATSIADATGTHAGTPTLTTTTQVGAKLGGGLAFTGGNDTITFVNPLTGNSAHTISVWVNQPAVTHVSAVLVVGTAMTSQSRFLYTHFTSAVMAIGYYGNDWQTNIDLDNTGWTLLHWVSEGSNGKNHLYQNGAEIPGSPVTITGINTMGTTGIIGHAPEPAYGTNTGLQGTIDELRIATVVRSAGWIAAEYANQSSPSTFYAVGAEEPVP
jgi:hypothetical protein